MRDYLFQKVGASSLYGFAVKQNAASIRVLEKIGFSYLQPIEYDGVVHQLYEAHRGS